MNGDPKPGEKGRHLLCNDACWNERWHCTRCGEVTSMYGHNPCPKDAEKDIPKYVPFSGGIF